MECARISGSPLHLKAKFGSRAKYLAQSARFRAPSPSHEFIYRGIFALICPLKFHYSIHISTFEGDWERLDGVFGNCVIQVLERPNESGNDYCLLHFHQGCSLFLKKILQIY